ncbi:MAG: pilin [Patescibacteria group bacterium]
MLLANNPFGNIANPYESGYGRQETALGSFIGNVVNAVFVVGGLLLFGYLIFGGFKFMTAGGDEEAIEKAKTMLTNAIIGLIIIATAYFITMILQTILGIDILSPEFVGP